MTTATANERKSRKGHKGAGGRPKGSKDTRPRMNISLRNAMALFLDRDGNLVTDRLRQALQDPDGRVGIAAVKVALDYHLKTGGARPAGKGLVIRLSSNTDPLAEKSGRPGPVIDLTLGSVIDAEPRASDTGARAKPPAPASPKPLAPWPAAAVAKALAEQAAKVAKPKMNKLPRQLQDKDGEDMVEMLEPRYLFEDPDTPPRGNPWRDSWP